MTLVWGLVALLKFFLAWLVDCLCRPFVWIPEGVTLLEQSTSGPIRQLSKIFTIPMTTHSPSHHFGAQCSKLTPSTNHAGPTSATTGHGQGPDGSCTVPTFGRTVLMSTPCIPSPLFLSLFRMLNCSILRLTSWRYRTLLDHSNVCFTTLRVC